MLIAALVNDCQGFDTGIAECSTVEHLFEAIFTLCLLSLV